MRDPFQIFIKPAGSECNLNCSYCYYLQTPSAGSNRVMDDSVLERLIKSQIEATFDDTVMFSWHGGEPLIAGIEFYKKVLAFQKKYLPAGKRLLNGIQTNGTLITPDLCRFFNDEGFIAGISIDGPEEIHNRFRINVNGRGSFREAMRGYELLQKFSVASEILCVVGSHNEKAPEIVYDFFRSVAVKYLTFLPLVIRDPANLNKALPPSVDPVKFGDFLIKVFDLWVERDIGNVQVQVFEEAIQTAFKPEHTLCIFKVNCGGVPVIEKNGDFYSCDHYVDKEHLVGNVMSHTVDELLSSEQQKGFGRAKSESLPGYCRQCEVLNMCNGECPKNRFINTPGGEKGLNYLCAGYKKFFLHCRPFVEAISSLSSGGN